MAREVIGGLLACAPLTDGEGPSGDDAGEADADANERAGWRAATLHVASCR